MIYFVRTFLVLCFLVFSVCRPSVSNLWAQTGREIQGISGRLDRLIKEVALIEEEQQKIFSEQEKTIETIKNLKIWARG